MDNRLRRRLSLGFELFFVATIVWNSMKTIAAERYTPFESERTTWHEGFDRYHFIMDNTTGTVTPTKAPGR